MKDLLEKLKKADAKQKTLNDYSYSLIQLNISESNEVINLGVVLKDIKENSFLYHMIKPNDLKKCIGSSKIKIIESAYENIEYYVENKFECFDEKVNNSVKLSALKPLSLEKEADEALNYLLNRKLTIINKPQLIRKKRDENIFDKKHITRELISIKERNNIKNMDFNKMITINNSTRKVDTISYKNDKEKELIVAGEIVSLYVNSSSDTFFKAMQTMYMLANHPTLKERIMYIPRTRYIDAQQRENFTIMRDMCNSSKIFLCDSEHKENYIGEVQKLTKMYT